MRKWPKRITLETREKHLSVEDGAEEKEPDLEAEEKRTIGQHYEKIRRCISW